jgi:hypothetical protein
LPRLLAAADNAAMQIEPSKADPPKRKRRWFQFSLRILLIVITIMAVQIAVCLPLLLERQQQRERALADNWLRNHSHSSPPILEGFRVRR